MKTFKSHAAYICFSILFLFIILLYCYFNQPVIRVLNKKVFVADPQVSLNYPNSYIPIQFINYTKSGLWHKKDLPISSFTSPYSVKLKDREPGTEITINAVGDIMSNADVQLTAYLHRHDKEETAGGYDWIFSPLKQILSDADFTTGNLETPTSPSYPYTGSNKIFNASPLLLKGLKNAGFDVLQLANNHALDMTEKGLLDTIEKITEYDMDYIGAEKDGENLDRTRKITCKNINVALLNYTFLSNVKPTGKNYLNFLPKDSDRAEIISNDIKSAKEAGSDFIIVFLHWGREYHKLPLIASKQLATHLFISGADMIIGAHPHVIQAMELIYTHNNIPVDKFKPALKNIT